MDLIVKRLFNGLYMLRMSGCNKLKWIPGMEDLPLHELVNKRKKALPVEEPY